MSPASGGTEPEGPTIDPRIWQRRQSIQRSRGRRRLQWIGGVVGVFLLVVVVVALLHTRWFSAQVITVTGRHAHTSEAAIIDAAGLEHHPPLISVDPGATAEKVEALPFIASARVHRSWPDGVTISVTERAPVVQMAGPGTSWSILDGAGRTLQVQPAKVPGLIAYTVGTGASAIHPAPVGGSLPARPPPASWSVEPCPRPSSPRWCRCRWPLTGASRLPSTRGSPSFWVRMPT